MKVKTAAIAACLALQATVASAVDTFLNSPKSSRGSRSNTIRAATKTGKRVSMSSVCSDDVGKKNAMSSSPSDSDVCADAPTLRRFTKDRTVTLHGVSHDQPLNVQEVVFLEEALLDAMNEVHRDDDIITRSAVLTEEELDEEYYYASSPGDAKNGNSTGHFRGNGRRELFDESIDNGDFFDIHILLDIICYLCNEDVDDDPRIIRTRSPVMPTRGPTRRPARPPTRGPTKAPTKALAKPPTNVPTKAVPTKVPTKPLAAAARANINRRGLSSRGGTPTALETAFCTTVRASSFSRFRNTTSCDIE